MARLSSTVLVITALIAALVPAQAFAAELATAAKQSAPAKVEMYVLSTKGDTAYEYNSKGLLLKRSNATTTTVFKYSGTTVKSYASKFSHGSSSSVTRASLTYDKKGRLSTLATTGSSNATDAFAYNKAGRVTRLTHDAANQRTILYKCAYDADGRLIRKNASGGDSTKKTFTYDAKGNLASITHSFGSGGYSQTFANKYNKAGRLTKRITTITSGGSFSSAEKFTYKKIAVPAKCADQVKEQQWALLNKEVSIASPLSY